MRKWVKPYKVACVSAAVALLATGCSAASPADSSSTTIASLLGLPEDGSVDWQDKTHHVQELVARCMRDEGWEYMPLNLPDVSPGWDLDNQRESYQERGFGIAWATLHVGEQDPQDPYADWVDPNEEYRNGLTETELAAYWASLMGTEAEQAESLHTSTDPVTGMTSVEVGGEYGYGPGCNGQAHEAVYGANPSARQIQLEAVRQFYQDLDTRIAADPRAVALNAAWSECMAREGFDVDAPIEIWNIEFPRIQRRHAQIVPVPVTSEDQLSEDQRERLKQLLRDEISLAVAHFDCSQDYDVTMARLAAEIEQAFALEHESQLRELAVALAQDG